MPNNNNSNNNGNDGSWFQLTTHLTDRTSLRHFLSGLKKIEHLCRRAELVQINRVDVTSWSHEQVVCLLHQRLACVSEEEIILTLRARDKEGQKHVIEVEINVVFEDGFSLGDKARAAYEVLVRVTDKIVTTPDVTDVMYETSYYIRIRHGAQTGFFMKEDSNHTMCMAIPPSENNDYVFKCYNFIGHNQEGGGEGGGGEEGGFPRLCVLQHPSSGRFVAACPTSGCLTTDDDEGFRTNIRSITTPDCHFFVVHTSGNGESETFCLRPLVMHNYYLRYDAVRGLRLKKCVPPPYKNFAVVRFFSFEFVQANYSAH
ncbi:hypothetical protein ACOMHN_006739 [Nucella lapillus]